MKKYAFVLNIVWLLLVCCSFVANAQINFNSSNLSNFTIANPTSLQFGPDGRLYVAQQDGTIKIFTVSKNASGYTVTATETILLVKQIPNHYDDGSPKPFNMFTNKRQVTGIYVTGTTANPVIYVCSSDSDMGAGANGDKNLCTNSGILSKLTYVAGQWKKLDLVRGLPRSEENHAPNGIQIDEEKKILYLAVGGFTNAGSPSKLFTYITEYALSAAILSIDLNAIELMPIKDAAGTHPYVYDVPTLDDPTRSNNPDGSDINDPFGGNDGLNQSKIVIGGPVQLFATGFRNPYDLVITKSPGKAGRMYTIDNAANPNWGGYPENEGPQGTATNNYVPGEPGSLTAGAHDAVVNNLDGLHKIDLATYVPGTYYGGHPCPVRANPEGAGLYTHEGTLETGTGFWRTSKTHPTHPLPSDWPPIPVSMAHAIEGDYQNPGVSNTALLTFDVSTNGICEYRASNFSSAMKGDLLAINHEGFMYRIKIAADGSVLNAKGNKMMNQDPALASGFGSKGLDITSQGDDEIFPGTIWVVNYASNTITVFEPVEQPCAGQYSDTIDGDGDGYTNADELDSGTDPCSAASKPEDNDQDFISDLKDTDDDNDGLPDTSDPFALDKFNGTTTYMPVTYTLFNNDPGTGFFGLGFTGLMTNHVSDYRSLFQKQNLIAGGAIGAFTIDKVPNGDALGNLNTQENAFQFGVKVSNETPAFLVKGIMLGGFFNGTTPVNFQSQGIYIGNGDQDNYIKVVLNSNGGQGGIEVVVENQGVATSNQFSIPGIPTSTAELVLAVEPATSQVTIKVGLDGGTYTPIGNTIQLAGPLLQVFQNSQGLAVGIISTSRNATTFNASWDLIEVVPDPSKMKGEWEYLTSSDMSAPINRHENGFVECGNKFYLIGGRSIKAVNEYDPSTKTWKVKAKTPIELNHFQAVSHGNLIYIVGAFQGGYPHETPVPNIYIYDPATDKWTKGREIPAERRRGSAGVAVYKNKIYVAGGIIDGHYSGFVNWLDEYNPATNEWKILPDAPRFRDHFNAAVNGDKLYLAGGRKSSGITNQVFNLTIAEVDIYDFNTNTWSTNPNNLPTPRGGSTSVSLYNEVVVIGGESMAHMKAHNEAEALNINTGTWRTLDTLNTGRHGTQAISSNGGIYITGGSSSRGGSAATELVSVEEFHLTDKLPPNGLAITRSGLQAPATYSFGTIASGTVKSDSLSLKSLDGNQGIIIKEIKLKNNSGNLFSFQSKYVVPYSLLPGATNKIGISFNSTSSTPATAQLVIIHTGKGDSTVVALSANDGIVTPPPTSAWTPLFFINAGGSSTTLESNLWLDDSPATPSSFSNHSSTFNKTTQVSYNGVNTTDAPTAIFNSYRWDGGVKGNTISQEMQWKFPVPDQGYYKIDLYFTESYAGHTVAGKRVFDIMIEDTIRSDNFDIVAEAGFKNAIKKSYTLFIKDGYANIYFLHEIQNPIINGIAVYKKSISSSAEVMPQALDFGDQILNTGTSKSVKIKNTGQGELTLTNASLQGTDASNFVHDFTSIKKIQPGNEITVNVLFTPNASGVKSGLLKIFSPDLNLPLELPLSGKGIAGSTNVSIIKPTDGEVFSLGDTIGIEAIVNAGEAIPFMKVNCMDGAWRKLRMGYNATNIFNPKNNVIAGGNTTVEIILKSLTPSLNWSKIQIRPLGVSNSPIAIGDYMNTSEILSDGYFRIKIPLSDFSSTIDFTQLTNIEFPYSAGAGIFEIHLQSIIFSGGTNPFVWFGNGKIDNKHDGLGGAGQLIAELKTASAKQVSNVLFYQNSVLLGSDATPPYQYQWTSAVKGSYALTAKTVFSDGVEETSNVVSVSVNEQLYDGLKIVVVFDQAPETYSVSNAALRFDKDFAYSFTLDDGKDDAYTRALPVLNGGYVPFNNTTYPGLFYTDGCGNNFPFRAGIAWNSQNSVGKDLHVNTPGYLTWTQLNDLYNTNKWNIFNHSLNHKTGSGTDYEYQVNENRRILLEKTGIDLKHFVIPSGDINYESVAFVNGMVAVYNQSGNYPGANGGLKVDGNVSLDNFKLNRKYLDDNKYNTANIASFIDQVAAKSINGNHFWYNDFTHKVSENPSGGSLVFSTFEYYMQYVEQTYGKSGLDNVWMAPLQDVYEYIAVKNNIQYATQLKGNRLEIYFDTTGISPELLKYALTLKINSDVNFSNVETTGFAWHSFRGTGGNKIINLEWNKNLATTSTARIANEYNIKSAEVLYRINVGGDKMMSPAGAWESDKDYLATNKTIVIKNAEAISLTGSIPEETPVGIFSSARTSEGDSLSWNFPVDEGGEVEVRLYFAETYFNETNKRIFDVAIENTVTLSEFDIAAEGGKNKAVMKSFVTTSDGMLDINLIRIKHNPSVKGIEIICLNNRCNSKRVAMSGVEYKNKISATAYPNPFGDKLMVNFSGSESEKIIVRVYDSMGEVLKEVDVPLEKASEIQMDLSGLPTGVYFMKIVSGNTVNETIKVIKQ